MVFSYYLNHYPKSERNQESLKLNDLNPLASIGKFITRPIIGIFLAVFIIVNFTFSGFTITLPVYVINKFAIDPLNIGGLLFVAGVVSSVVQGGLIGKLSKKFGDKNLLITGILFLTSGLILFLFTQIFWLLYIILGIISMGIGLITPTLNSLISKMVLPSELGEVFGVNTSLNSLMTIIGPLTAGLIYDYINPTAPYWLGAILLMIAFVLMVRIKAPMATRIKL